MSESKVGWRIFWRCLLEFGPPAVIGAIWATWNFNGTAASAVANFSAAFVTLGIIWANFLRIQYQQTTRAHQDSTQAKIDSIAADLLRVEGSVLKLTHIVSVDGAALPPDRAREIASAVKEANTAIETANSAVRSLSSSIGREIVRGTLGGILRREEKDRPRS